MSEQNTGDLAALVNGCDLKEFEFSPIPIPPDMLESHARLRGKFTELRKRLAGVAEERQQLLKALNGRYDAKVFGKLRDNEPRLLAILQEEIDLREEVDSWLSVIGGMIGDAASQAFGELNETEKKLLESVQAIGFGPGFLSDLLKSREFQKAMANHPALNKLRTRAGSLRHFADSMRQGKNSEGSINRQRQDAVGRVISKAVEHAKQTVSTI